MWSDIIGVTFVEVTTGGQITFDDNQEGAAATSQYSGGITTSAHVNVDVQWLTDYGRRLTAMLSRPTYTKSGTHWGLATPEVTTAMRRIRMTPTSRMTAGPSASCPISTRTRAPTTRAWGSPKAYAVTPMVADIIAIGNLYGLRRRPASATRLTGYNSTAGRAVYDANLSGTTFTIFDSGGNDTINYSAWRWVGKSADRSCAGGLFQCWRANRQPRDCTRHGDRERDEWRRQ